MTHYYNTFGIQTYCSKEIVSFYLNWVIFIVTDSVLILCICLHSQQGHGKELGSCPLVS
uniref:Uncharacterized protein n=1 Tax=Anguilla anguilla TaxID=7936 RepID=A0A0E9QVT7_ANGAN